MHSGEVKLGILNALKGVKLSGLRELFRLFGLNCLCVLIKVSVFIDAERTVRVSGVKLCVLRVSGE